MGTSNQCRCLSRLTRLPHGRGCCEVCESPSSWHGILIERSKTGAGRRRLSLFILFFLFFYSFPASLLTFDIRSTSYPSSVLLRDEACTTDFIPRWILFCGIRWQRATTFWMLVLRLGLRFCK